MYKKSLVTFILICLSNLAYAQVADKVAQGNGTVATAIKNTEIDESKYARPDDFLYEEKVEDQVQPVQEEQYINEQVQQEDSEAAAQQIQQQILEQEAEEQQEREPASSEAL